MQTGPAGLRPLWNAIFQGGDCFSLWEYSGIRTVNLPDEKRSLSAEKLKKTAGVYCKGTVLAMDGIDQAVEEAMRDAGERDVILAFGSLSYLGRVMEVVQKKTAG